MMMWLVLENTPLKGRQGKVWQNAMDSIPKILRAVHDQRTGLNRNPEFNAKWRGFSEAGGLTGWRDLFMTGEEQSKEIIKMLDPSKFQKAWKGLGGEAIGHMLEDFNSALENALRFAVYEEGRSMGFSAVRSASMAKDATTNFNRTGRWGPQIGSLYAFYNATIQGGERVATTLFKEGGPSKQLPPPRRKALPPPRFLKIINPPGQPKKTVLTQAGKKFLMAGMAVGAMQAMSLYMLGYEVDEPPEFIKSKALIIPTPFVTEKGYYAQPLAWGFNILPNMGRLAMEAFLYGDPADKAKKLGFAFMDSFSPAGGAGSWKQEAAPTLADPFVAAAENKTWTGDPMYTPDLFESKPTKGSSRAWEGTSEWAIAVSDLVDYAFLGDENVPGSWSPEPEIWEYFVEFIAGGPGRETMRLGRLYDEAMKGEFHVRNVPLLGHLIGDAENSARDWGRWKKNMLTLHFENLQLEGRKSDEIATKKYKSGHPYAAMVEKGKLAGNAMQALRDRLDDLKAQKPGVEVTSNLEETEDEITKLLKKFNEEMAGIE
jgi:hypothetical protein